MHTCATCHIGTLHLNKATYAAWHADQFVVVPALPTWVCDVCGERTYDDAALDQLLSLIGPASPRPGFDDEDADIRRQSDLPPSLANDRTRRRA